jgi:hypothetical protein
MKSQLHTTISRRRLAAGTAVVAGLCVAAPTTSAAMPGPQGEYAAPAVMRTGTYLRVHPNRHVLAGKRLHRATYLPRHVMLAP